MIADLDNDRAPDDGTHFDGFLSKIKDSRDPFQREGAARPANPIPPSIINFAGSTGSTGSAPLKPAEIRRFAGAGPGTHSPRVTGSAGSSVTAGSRGSRSLDFAAINAAALRELPALLPRWLPDGRRNGREYTARNPRRADRNPGSFRVNLRTGRWADFATGDAGGDPVSLAAYLFNLSQGAAARRLADMLGVP